MKWIPCSKKLPNHLQDVIGCEKNGYITTYRFDAAEPPCWFDDHEEVFRLNEIVAWMPLPEPYKPTESEDH